jgi:hypothetical protein
MAVGSVSLRPAGAAAGSTVGNAIPPTWSLSPSTDTAGVNNFFIASTCADAWDCWNVGATIATQPQAPIVGAAQHWNGSSWTAVPTEAPGDHQSWLFTAVSCVDRDDCWAVGATMTETSPPSPLTEHWNGSTWSIVASETVYGYLLGVSCASSDACLAVGARTDSSANQTIELTEHWDGTAWSVAPSISTGRTYSELNGIDCPLVSECWAVGTDGPNPQNTDFLPIFPAAAGDQGLTARWNGSSWSEVSSPQFPDGGYLSAVTCVDALDCLSVGSETGATGGANSALVEHWSGGAWADLDGPSFGGESGIFLHQVTCITTSDCLAVGSSGLQPPPHSLNGGNVRTISAAWDGSTWSAVATAPGLVAVGFLSGLACAGAQCFASGFTGSKKTGLLQNLVEELSLGQGYRLVGSDGGVFSFGDAGFHGSLSGTHLSAPVVGIASPDDDGYWLVGADGGVFSFGDAGFHGSMGGKRLTAPVVGITTAGDAGYWLVGSDGGVFSFGDAGFHGSMGGKQLSAPIVGMVSTPDGGGYWLVGSDGGVFSFGDATFYGSMAGHKLAAPAVGMTTSGDAKGYWLVGADGGVFAFGDAQFEGSTGGKVLAAPVVGAA